MVTVDSIQGGHGDAVSYLLGALDVPARARFEAHAQECAECRQELAELQPVTDELALGVAQVAPPPQLRQRLLFRAQLTPQVDTVPWPAQPVAPHPAVIASRRPWWHGANRLLPAVVAASLMVAAGSGSYALAARRELADVSKTAEYASAQLSETLSIVYQPNMVTRSLSGMEAAPHATGKVVIAPDRNKAVVIAYSLPAVKKDESYQCWLTGQDDKRVEVGSFQPDGSGKAYWVLRAPEAMARYRWMGVTREAGKGASGPSRPWVLGGQL